MPYIGDSVAMVLAVAQLAVEMLHVWELKAMLLMTVAQLTLVT